MGLLRGYASIIITGGGGGGGGFWSARLGGGGDQHGGDFTLRLTLLSVFLGNTLGIQRM